MKAYIIEDEPAAAERLIKMVRDADPSISVIRTMETVEEAIEAFTLLPHPDLVFMDIHLADGECFEIFDHVAVHSHIIFTTAYDQYAIRAFRVHAVDYLMKPIKPAELADAINQVYLKRGTDATLPGQLTEEVYRDRARQASRFLIRLGQQIRLLSHEDIAWCYIADKVTLMVTFDGKRYPTDHSLDQLESVLPHRMFYRVNRQCIVSLRAISKMEPATKSRIRLELEPPAPMEVFSSTERSPGFKRWLKGE